MNEKVDCLAFLFGRMRARDKTRKVEVRGRARLEFGGIHFISLFYWEY
jgi:hypothetical protein